MLRYWIVCIVIFRQASASCVSEGVTYNENDKWIDESDHIQYQCIENGGIKPTGCAPKGLPVVQAPGTWSDKNFKYECVITNGTPPKIRYDAIACIDYLGREFAVGQEFVRNSTNLSTKYLCSKENGKVTLTKISTGCALDGNFVPLGSSATSNGFQQTCSDMGKGVYSLKTTACMFENNAIDTKRWKLINQDYYACKAVNVSLSSSGFILEKVGNYYCNDHKLGETWIEGSVKKYCDLYTTNYTVYILDKGCYNSTTNVSLDAKTLVRRSDGSAYYCDLGRGFIYITYSVSSCRLSDGTSINALKTSSDKDGVRYYCAFNFQTGTSTLKVQDCLIAGTSMYAAANNKGTKVSDGVAFSCREVDGKWVSVQMNETEYQLHYGVSNSESITADDGGGEGLNGVTTTTTSTRAPTTARLTPVPTHAPTQAPTHAQTPAPTNAPTHPTITPAPLTTRPAPTLVPSKETAECEDKCDICATLAHACHEPVESDDDEDCEDDSEESVEVKTNSTHNQIFPFFKHNSTGNHEFHLGFGQKFFSRQRRHGKEQKYNTYTQHNSNNQGGNNAAWNGLLNWNQKKDDSAKAGTNGIFSWVKNWGTGTGTTNKKSSHEDKKEDNKQTENKNKQNNNEHANNDKDKGKKDEKDNTHFGQNSKDGKNCTKGVGNKVEHSKETKQTGGKGEHSKENKQTGGKDGGKSKGKDDQSSGSHEQEHAKNKGKDGSKKDHSKGSKEDKKDKSNEKNNKSSGSHEKYGKSDNKNKAKGKSNEKKGSHEKFDNGKNGKNCTNGTNKGDKDKHPKQNHSGSSEEKGNKHTKPNHSGSSEEKGKNTDNKGHGHKKCKGYKHRKCQGCNKIKTDYTKLVRQLCPKTCNACVVIAHTPIPARAQG